MEPETLGYRVSIVNQGQLVRVRRGQFEINAEREGTIFPSSGGAWGAWAKFSSEYEHGHQDVSLIRVYETRLEERRHAEAERRRGDRRA